MTINYIKGDATTYNPKTIIAHVCNVQGGWGAGFVLALSNKWEAPERAYRRIKEYQLGTIQIVNVEDDMKVCNMMAQNGYRSPDNDHPLDLEALAVCLGKLDNYAKEHDMSIQMPMIGAGLGGGNWEEISTLIETVMTQPVTVYEFD